MHMVAVSDHRWATLEPRAEPEPGMVAGIALREAISALDKPRQFMLQSNLR